MHHMLMCTDVHICECASADICAKHASDLLQFFGTGQNREESTN